MTANISFFQCENDRQLNRHDVCNVLHKTVAVHMHRYDKAAVLSRRLRHQHCMLHSLYISSVSAIYVTSGLMKSVRFLRVHTQARHTYYVGEMITRD